MNCKSRLGLCVYFITKLILSSSLLVLPFKSNSWILLAKKQEELEQSELEHWLSYEASR